MEHKIDEIISNFYLVFQPIFTVKPQQKEVLFAYEILLRSTHQDCFPREQMDEFARTDALNGRLFGWYAQQLTGYFQQYPTTLFYFNVHPNQLFFATTWDFLKQMKPYAKQLRIEITEYLLDSQYHDKELNQKIEDLYQMGYRIALDDVEQGQNTLALALANLKALSSVKFSLLTFQQLEQPTILAFMRAWQTFANENQLFMVVEGVETEAQSQQLAHDQFIIQQGFYWSRAIRL